MTAGAEQRRARPDADPSNGTTGSLTAPDGGLLAYGIQRSFGEQFAVDVPHLELPPGAISVLLGPSGCGKTTMLRIIAGFELPDAGCVTLGGRLLTAPGRHVPPEDRGIGMVFQDHALFPHLRVGENVGYGLRRRRTGKRERSARVAEMLELVGLQGYERRYPHELSGGQQQRIALARALAPSPEVLLLDEPFSGLDAESRVRIRREVKEILHAAEATALLVTHDQDEALSLAESLMIMRDGRIVQRGAPTEVYAAPSTPWVAGFLGDVDIVPGTVEDGSARCELGAFPAGDVTDARVHVAFRPEALAISAAGTGLVTATIERTEFFGHDMLIHLRLPSGVAVRSRVVGPPSGDDRPRTLADGSRVDVRLLGAPQIYPAGRGSGPAAA